MTTSQKDILHKVLKLGFGNMDDIRTFFSLETPTPALLNKTDEHGDTLAHFAARTHALPLLQLLSQYQANMEAINEHGRSPLHEAIDDIMCIQYLVDHCHVDCNAMKRGDWTPVMIAALKGDLPIVRFLVQHGAFLNLTSKDGRTALHMAVQEGHLEVAEYLTVSFPQALLAATTSGRLPVQMAAALTADHRSTGEKLTKFLLTFDATNHDRLAHAMVSHADKSGRTVLEDAVVANQINLVTWLIRNFDTSPTRQDALGRNCWHHAAMMGHLEMLKQLQDTTIVKLGEGKASLLDATDIWDQWTPLMYAAKNGHLNCTCYLLQMGSDATKKDKLGRTAKDLALLWHHDNVVKLFESL